MNALAQETKAQIIKRQIHRSSFRADTTVLRAVEAYCEAAGPAESAKAFMTQMRPLWEVYRKETYAKIFKHFIDFEIGLEYFSPSYISHARHVIEEFMLGYNVLTTSNYVREQYSGGALRGDDADVFGELFFAWMAASLFHDVGYDIERSLDEEKSRRKKNAYWDFMSPRAVTKGDVIMRRESHGWRVLEEHLLPDLSPYLPDEITSADSLEQFFMRSAKGGVEGQQYDHGFISAIKYLVELDRLQQQRGGGYLNWQPNHRAVVAMAMHNCRYRSCSPAFRFTNPDAAPAYLLMVCDEVQQWGRSRVLPLLEGSAAKVPIGLKRTSIEAAAFDATMALVTVNHISGSPMSRKDIARWIAKRVKGQIEKFPVTVETDAFWENAQGLLEEGCMASMSQAIGVRNADLSRGMHHEDTRHRAQREGNTAFRMRLVNEMRSQRGHTDILVPEEPAVYSVYIDHRIDGEPFVTVRFPF